MSVYKEEKTGTWRVLYRYTDWTGEKKQTQKRGFKTKREAQAWEREQMNKVESSLDMTFESFVERYREDKAGRIKENTWEMKNHIIETKLLPYFGKLKMDSITAQQIITWQNELLNYKDDKGKAYSPVYLKTVHNQLTPSLWEIPSRDRCCLWRSRWSRILAHRGGLALPNSIGTATG